jgi:drug/metabolite transporter (DMT)-like permease
VMIPLALLREEPWHISFDPKAIAAALWLAVVSTALADILYFRLIASAGPTFFSLINYIVPVVAAAAGVAVLGEVMPGTALAALALILAGLALGQRPSAGTT